MLGRRRGELGVAVVLAEEDHRQLPDGGEVQRLVEGALRRRAVAEEGHRHAAVGPQLRRRRRPHRDRQARGHDAVGAEDPELRVGDVHGAAAAAVGALVLAHQLGEHPGRVQALGQAVAVAAVGRGDDVGGPKRPARADGRRLLPDREVDEAGDLAVAVERGHPLLEAADQQHPAVHLEEVGRREARSGQKGRRSSNVYCTGRYNMRKAMTEPDRDPRVVPRPRRGLGEAGGDHRRQPRPRRLLAHAFSGPARRWRWWPARSGT